MYNKIFYWFFLFWYENDIFLTFLYNFQRGFKSKIFFDLIQIFFLRGCRSHWCKYYYSIIFFKWFFWLHRQYAWIFWIDFMFCWLFEILIDFQFMTFSFSWFAEFDCTVIIWSVILFRVAIGSERKHQFLFRRIQKFQTKVRRKSNCINNALTIQNFINLFINLFII